MKHIYYGDGKGKTTAAMGLALRQLGADKRVVVAQFLKDGTSSELSVLEKMGAVVIHTLMPQRFVKDMDEEEKDMVKKSVLAIWTQAIDASCDCIILDELLDCIHLGLISEERILETLAKETSREVVLTGRNPSDDLLSLVDYVSEMRSHKHPYQKGIIARKGVEF